MNDKLMAIQQGLKAPKDKKNTFANFQYRNAEHILENVKPLLAKQKLTLTLSDEPILVGEWNYIKSTATVSDGTDKISVSAVAHEEEDKKGMDKAQVSGSTSSYARKYALSGLFAIDDSRDDPDGKDNTKPAPKQTPEPKPEPTPEVDPLAKAKDNLNKALEKAGHNNTVRKKMFISKVLDKSTVDSEAEANQVMEAITNENQS